MRSRVKICIGLLLLVTPYSYGQLEQYDYKRELKGISGQWHKIVLPDDLFGKVLPDRTDIRVLGITTASDTIEVPYILRLTDEKISRKEVAFKTLNASHSGKGYFFTFEIPTEESVNQIELEFKQENFDWRVKLEGSQDQQEWFTVAENYRILSIQNEWTDFQFTKLTFPPSKYRFFRLLIESEKKPDLTLAKISQLDVTDGIFKNYPIKEIKTKENKRPNRTEIDIDLQMPVPIGHIKIGIADTFDYYRPFTVKYLTDSVNTDKGWKYNYNTLASGTLNSLEVNEFKVSSTTAQRLKFIIHNQDNRPLIIDTIQINGYVHELLARFTEPASYFLVYGNKKAVKPQYDISRFTDKVPGTLTTLELGREQAIEKNELPRADPLFKNKTWLWAIMALIIGLLGWFSVKMIGKK